MPRYASVELERIIAEENLPGPIYIFVSGHFIKYKNEGEEIPTAKYDDFICKKIQHLFVELRHVDRFDSWFDDFTTREKREIIERVGEDATEVVEAKMALKEETQRVFSSSELTDESCLELQQKTRDFVEKMNDSSMVQKGIKLMNSHSRSLADHANNVATLSIYLAYHLGYTHQIILENIYLGALFHDFGKTLIDPKQLEGKPLDFIANVLRKHPQIGAQALKLKTSIPEEVCLMVSQHHEQNNGEGYPKGLKGSRIYDLTKIVSIANDFDRFVVECNQGDLEARQRYAIARLEEDKGDLYDPKKLEKVIKVLKTAL